MPAAPAESGVYIDWEDDGFDTGDYDDVTADTIGWVIRRGASSDLHGDSPTGSMTLTLRDLDGKYNPEDVSSPIHDFLRDGPKVYVAIDSDGTFGNSAPKGRFAGYITDITPIPGDGTQTPPTVEIVCEDPFGWWARLPVKLRGIAGEAQDAFRLRVIQEIDIEAQADVPVEPTTMFISSADGYAINILEALNIANGSRHYIRPADPGDPDWFSYVVVRRTDRLTGVANTDLTDPTDHVTSTDGWRQSADMIVNQQRVTANPIDFTNPRHVVWQAPVVPFSYEDTLEIFAEFDDFVEHAEIDYESDGPQPGLDDFGSTAKITLESGPATVTKLLVRGRLAVRLLPQSATTDDPTSQTAPRGVRSGSEISGDYVGPLPAAQGMADHMVWRFANPMKRPSVTVHNWFPDMYERDLLDLVAATSTQLAVTARIFEIVGLTETSDCAHPDAIHHVIDYVLQESRVQEPTDWFTWDTTEWDDATQPLAY